MTPFLTISFIFRPASPMTFEHALKVHSGGRFWLVASRICLLSRAWTLSILIPPIVLLESNQAVLIVVRLASHASFDAFSRHVLTRFQRWVKLFLAIANELLPVRNGLTFRNFARRWDLSLTI